MDVIYDTETFPNCYLLNAMCVGTGQRWTFEISQFANETNQLREWLAWLVRNNRRMVGFNNLAFDYPVLHFLLQAGQMHPKDIYDYAMTIIKRDGFNNYVPTAEVFVPQIDLLKIHHFDNKARMTGLKSLEFNMRQPIISTMPIPVGTVLTREQIETVREYCWDDVDATYRFWRQTLEQIDFREQLAATYHDSAFLNYSDVKIGKVYFQRALEKSGIRCYSGGKPIQTPRSMIRLGDCMPAGITLMNHEFSRIQEQLQATVISETKGAFKDLNATVDDVEYVFGTGGIHASVNNKIYRSSDNMMIVDLDVTSLYPSIAITQGYYPEHLGPKFVEVYKKLLNERLMHPKGSMENAMLKLALNGVYGASNDKYSIFYDPQFTMKITIGGQMMIARLIEMIVRSGMKIIQANTDGVTVYLPRQTEQMLKEICYKWQSLTHLNLESVEYDFMAIADVNSYLARTVDGKVKRKGRYEYNVDWHQNASALVVPKVAEMVLLEGVDPDKTVAEWGDFMDFMLRAKIPSTSRLMMTKDGVTTRLANLQRYYVSTEGGVLTKIMPPLPKKMEKGERHFAVQSGWKVCPCNDLTKAIEPIDHDYYINEVLKLTEEMENA